MSDESLTTIPALIASETVMRPAIVYDRWWVQTLVMQAPSPTSESSANVVLARYASSDGSLSGETVNLTLDNLFMRSVDDPALLAAMAGIVGVVQRIAVGQGIATDGTESTPN